MKKIKRKGGIKPSSPQNITRSCIMSTTRCRQIKGSVVESNGGQRSVILRVNGRAERLSHAPLTNDLIPGELWWRVPENMYQIGKKRHPRSTFPLFPLQVFALFPHCVSLKRGWLLPIERRVHWGSCFWSHGQCAAFFNISILHFTHCGPWGWW